MKKKLKWEIFLYDGTRELFSTEIGHGCTSARMVTELLKTLVSKASLTYEEIADCYTTRNTKRHANHLDTAAEGTQTRYMITCGQNPHAVAVVNHGGIN